METGRWDAEQGTQNKGRRTKDRETILLKIYNKCIVKTLTIKMIFEKINRENGIHRRGI